LFHIQLENLVFKANEVFQFSKGYFGQRRLNFRGKRGINTGNDRRQALTFASHVIFIYKNLPGLATGA
jgi:hypothetical protein